MALAGVATATEEYPTWDLKGYTGTDSNTSDAVTDANHNFWFNSTTTLQTYAFDFVIDTIGTADQVYTYTLFSTSRGDTSGALRFGLGLGATTRKDESLTCYIYAGTRDTKGTDATNDDATTFTKLNTDSITLNEGDKVRFAYDSATGTVFVYNASTKSLLTATTTNDESYYFTSGTANQSIGNSAIYTQGGGHKMTFGYVTDLSSIAGDVAAIKSYIVPEPTTATLSLLALAGLAARRRRK